MPKGRLLLSWLLWIIGNPLPLFMETSHLLAPPIFGGISHSCLSESLNPRGSSHECSPLDGCSPATISGPDKTCHHGPSSQVLEGYSQSSLRGWPWNLLTPGDTVYASLRIFLLTSALVPGPLCLRWGGEEHICIHFIQPPTLFQEMHSHQLSPSISFSCPFKLKEGD